MMKQFHDCAFTFEALTASMYSCPCSTTSFTNVSLALSAPLPNCDGRRASAILVQRGGCVWLVAGGWWLVTSSSSRREMMSSSRPSSSRSCRSSTKNRRGNGRRATLELDSSLSQSMMRPDTRCTGASLCLRYLPLPYKYQL
jgi:hypothetical protein